MEKYTQDLHDVIHCAELESAKLNSVYISTEHLLLGMLKKHEGIKNYFKDTYNITYASFKNKVIEVIGKGDTDVSRSLRIYTPKAKAALYAEDTSEYNIDTITVLKNIMEFGDGVAYRLLEDLKVNIKEVLNDIENGKIGNNYIAKEIDLNKQIDMEYFYDAIAAKKTGKDFIRFRKIPLISVNDKALDILTSHIVTLDATLSLSLYLRASIQETATKTTPANAVIILNREKEVGYILMFKYDKGVLTTEYVSSLIPEDTMDLLEIHELKQSLTEDEILTIHNEPISTLDVENIYINFIEKEEKKRQQNTNEIKNRQTSGTFKKMNCLSNINERVLTHGTEIVGMDNEMEQLIKGLMGIRKPNVMLKGEPGVGKTALVEKLADMINKGQVPEILKDKVIYELSMSGAVAGTKYRGEFEDKLNSIIKEAESNPNVILFVDEAHTLIGAGGAEGAIDASNILKPALARGYIKLIGATTNDEYDKYIKPDGALSRRFTTIEILEPLESQVKEIMKGIAPKFEQHYKVTITDKIINDLYNEAKLKRGMFPDIALDTLEDWCIKQNYADYEDELSAKKNEEQSKETKSKKGRKKMEVK